MTRLYNLSIRLTENSDLVQEHLSNPVIDKHILEYEEYLWSVIDGHLGPTVQFWAMYIFPINSLHRETQRCVKTNDVDGYIRVFPIMLEVFLHLIAQIMLDGGYSSCRN